MLFARQLTSLGAAAVMLVPPPAAGIHRPFWGPDGHRIVAQIALSRLSPAVADETRRLLDGQNIPDVASWADEHRRDLPGTAPWHYIDIEITDTSYVPARDCKDGACIIAALATQTAILGDRSRPDSARGIALRWVVHLVGDLHQPLHAGERGDRGGNDVKVTFQGKPTNLHSIWDSGLLLAWGQSDEEIEQSIENEIAHRNDIAAISGGSVVQWAMESHDIARDMVYRDLPQSLVIDQHYADLARPIIRDRLLRAGVRLGALLERTLGGKTR
ncbi:MAG TPA: S1/P1 nuclease [Gemmatimonadales bacterium]|jgi:hypothetical protein